MFAAFILLGLVIVLAAFVLLFMPRRMSRKRSSLLALAGFGAMFLGGALMPEEVRLEQQRAAEQRALEQKEEKRAEGEQLRTFERAIADALSEAGFPAAQAIEIDNGRLVVTFEFDDAALTLLEAKGFGSAREVASKAVITVRNAELPFDLVDSYRVTMNGPSPGPGLIMRYGSARFSEGGAVAWEPGPPR